MEFDFPISLFAHFDGPVNVPDHEALTIRTLKPGGIPPGKELEPPDALKQVAALELTVVHDDKSRLVFAAHGRGARIGSQRDRINAAQREGKDVEIHVFDDPGGKAA